MTAGVHHADMHVSPFVTSYVGSQFALALQATPLLENKQGNRVKKSCGDETCEKFVVPCGNFSFKAQAVFAGGLSDQVEGHVFYGGEVGRGVIGSDAAFVIAKDHVHYPM